MTQKYHKTKRSEGPFTLPKQHTPVGTKSQLLSLLGDTLLFPFQFDANVDVFRGGSQVEVAKWFQNSLLRSSARRSVGHVALHLCSPS